MYGLLLENLSEYIKSVYGEDKWEDIRRQAGIDSPSFSVHQVYPENMLNKLAKKAQQVLGVSEREFMDQMGVYFVGFVGQYGYDRVLSVLGRHMRDFLNGLDNLHEYLKFSYPRMRAPSFICENETKQGLTLHYRSKRRGFVYYTMGQIREVARHFYHKEMHIELVREEILFDTVHVTFQLTFDNRAFTLASLAMTREEKHLPISAHVLFEIFPFCIVFGADMVVRSIGNSLMVILPDLLGKKITAWFDLVRPLIAFKFQTILNRTNNIFELVTVEPVTDRISSNTPSQELVLHEDGSDPEKTLRLKGQMVYMENWRMIMFLGTPVMPDLDSLITTGLYINDLSMHDFSRDLMLAGTQQSVELKLALDQEQQKSKKLEESMRKLDEEMRRTDELLYQMIPKQVADRLRRGENPIDTCEMFDCVSILFSDVVTFTEICSRITPMEVVSMLNAMYSIFDTLTERNNVYKVETIGDAYMVVAGAPEKDSNHAEKVADMALDMIDAIRDLKDPSTGQHLRIRVGVHSGAVVAGIVGLKMPRYCLFGDSVNTASRMESTSEAMRIHVSESTKEFLGLNYKLGERGEIDVKGKGTMKTYWLHERDGRKPITVASFMPLPPHPTPAAITAERRASTIVAPSLKALMPANVCPAAAAGTLCSPPPTTTSGNETTGSISVPVPIQNNSGPTAEEQRGRMYSPVTFRDVAQRSIANSPVRNSFSGSEHARASRSNSTGHVFLRSPSDVFGSLILDTEEFLEDLHNSRSSMRRLSPTPPFRIGSAPSKPRPNNPDQFTPEELAVMDQVTPPSTAPARETVTTGGSLPSTSSVNSLDKIVMSTSSTTTTAATAATMPLAPPKPKITSMQQQQQQQQSTAVVVNSAMIALHRQQQQQQQQPKPKPTMAMAMAIVSNNNNSSNNSSMSNSSSRATSKESLSMSSPPLPRCHSAPLPMTKAARKALLAAKQTKALEKLDKMIEEASELEISTAKLHSLRLNHPFGLDGDGMDDDGGSMGCPLFLPPPPPPPAVHLSNSMSDTRICNHGHSHEMSAMHHHVSSNAVNINASTLCPHTHEVAKLSNSQSFTHTRGVVGTANHQCCSGFNHSRHSHHRMHTNACQLL